MKDVNKLMVAMLGALDTRAVEEAGGAVSEYLDGQTADARTWPTLTWSAACRTSGSAGTCVRAAFASSWKESRNTTGRRDTKTQLSLQDSRSSM